MSNAEKTAADRPARGGRGSFLSWKVMALVAIVVLGAGGAGAYWFLGSRLMAHPQKMAKMQEAPLPYFLEVKPFVASMVNAAGTPHFVQIGVNFTMAGAAAGNLVTAMLPEVTDTMRLTALTFKVEDIVTPAGVDKMRKAMLASVNKALLQRLGAERIMGVTGGDKDAVRQIYFTQLIIE
jgi:flagellar protein FliL